MTMARTMLVWSVIRSVSVGVFCGLYMACAYRNGFDKLDAGQIAGIITIISGVDAVKIKMMAKPPDKDD